MNNNLLYNSSHFPEIKAKDLWDEFESLRHELQLMSGIVQNEDFLPTTTDLLKFEGQSDEFIVRLKNLTNTVKLYFAKRCSETKEAL